VTAPGVLFLAAVACKVDLAGVGPPPPSAAPAAAPAAPPLYQLLYAAETGDTARRVGQRARMLVWLSDVGFTPEELLALRARAEAAAAASAAAAADAAAARDAEAALVPALQAVADRYATASPPDDAELERLAAALGSARADLPDPREARWKALTTELAAIGAWVESLPADRQARLSDSRFFLSHRVGPLTAPGAYTDWLGTPWNGSDFGALRVAEPPADEPELNIGGLWTADVVGQGPDQRIRGVRLASLLLVAFAEPGLVEAIDVKLGHRAAGDYAPR
jgi:hypothetical protein